MITITGTVGSSGKYLVTGIPVDTTANAVLKIAFENNTSGTNLALFAGTDANFEWRNSTVRFWRPRVPIFDDHRHPTALGQDHLRTPRGRHGEFAIHANGRIALHYLLQSSSEAL